MELQAYLCLTQKSSPEFVLNYTGDLTRTLYSELNNEWIWQYLESQAIQLGPNILVGNYHGHEMMNKLRLHFLRTFKDPCHPCESIVQLKVLIALISRNAIRFTAENLNELFTALEKMIKKPHKRLIEMVFYTLMILLTVNDDYSSIVYLQSILGNLSMFTEGKRLLYALESREPLNSKGSSAKPLMQICLVQEINEFFGFDVKVQEELIERSAKLIIGCSHGEKLDVSDMDDRCLAAYIHRGGKQIPIDSLLNSFKNSTDVHFLVLIEAVIEKNQYYISELQLMEVLTMSPEYSYRVLFYILLYNEKVKPQGYGFGFIFEIDVRYSLKQAGRGILEKLLNLVNEHLPWFFIYSLSDIGEPSPISDSFIFTFGHNLPNVSEEDLVQFRVILAYQPLKVALSVLDILEPLRTTQAQDLFNPLRIFNCLNLQELKNIEVGTSLLEVLLCAWQQLILKFDCQVSVQYRENFVLTMQSVCVQRLIDNLGINEEIDAVICEFLHGYWIENFMLIKLVHTQGYPEKLLSITVSKIPSLICTWDFIMDLVQNGSSKQKTFALQLAGQLSCKYPTQRLLEILRSCIQFIEENLILFSEDPSLNETLDLYVKAFPILNGRVKKLKRKFPKTYFSIDQSSLNFIR